MAYTASIPLSSEGISSTQARILANFLNIGTIASVDHGGFGTAIEGKHAAVHLTTASSPATGATEWGMFVKNDSLGQPQIYLTPPGSTPAGTLADLPVTGGATIIKLGDIVPAAPSPVPALDPRIGNGETRVFGGISLKWGHVLAGGGATAITYVGPGPTGLTLTDFANDTLVVLTQSPVNITFKTKFGFTVQSIGAPVYYDFIAIGY